MNGRHGWLSPTVATAGSMLGEAPVSPLPRVPHELGVIRRVIAVRTRSRGAALWADHGNGNPVIVRNAGENKLAPVAERTGAEVFGIRAPRIAGGRQQAHLSQSNRPGRSPPAVGGLGAAGLPRNRA